MNGTDSAFVSHLRSLAGRKVFFEPLAGNHGDRLIRLGAEHAMAKAGVRLVERPDAAEHIVVNGGGAMNDIWKGGTERFGELRGAFPRTPITVAPSSFLFRETDFAAVCGRGEAAVTLYCRERYSVEHLRDLKLPACATVELSRDLALELEDSELVAQLRRSVEKAHVLIAIRRDKEGSAGAIGRVRAGWLPAGIRRPLARLRDRIVAKSTDSRFESMIAEAGVGRDVPRVFSDVSSSVTWDGFLSAIRDSALIITDRLHIGILGHLLGKAVRLYPGGYHKITGVYEYSLSGPGSLTELVKPAAGERRSIAS